MSPGPGLTPELLTPIPLARHGGRLERATRDEPTAAFTRQDSRSGGGRGGGGGGATAGRGGALRSEQFGRRTVIWAYAVLDEARVGLGQRFAELDCQREEGGEG
eukprot:4914291-Prymnesium_polylepis.1